MATRFRCLAAEIAPFCPAGPEPITTRSNVESLIAGLRSRRRLTVAHWPEGSASRRTGGRPAQAPAFSPGLVLLVLDADQIDELLHPVGLLDAVDGETLPCSAVELTAHAHHVVDHLDLEVPRLAADVGDQPPFHLCFEPRVLGLFRRRAGGLGGDELEPV